MKPSIKTTLATNLAALMASSNRYKTNKRMADAAGLGLGTISRILNQEAAASIETVEAIAKKFGLSASQLLDTNLLSTANPVAQPSSPGDTPTTTGQRIAIAREAKGLDQLQLAEHCGISQQAISKLERGESRDPQASTILKISQATNCDLQWLLCGAASNHAQPLVQPQDPPALALTISTMRETHASGKIDDEGLLAIQRLLESMRKHKPPAQ